MFFENKKSIVSVTEQLKLYNLFKENDKIAVNYLKNSEENGDGLVHIEPTPTILPKPKNIFTKNGIRINGDLDKLHVNSPRDIYSLNRFHPKRDLLIIDNINKIRAKGLKVIHNVYQRKYNNGEKNGTGMGDFIRGTYFLLEFCEKYNFVARVIFNNCISNYFENKCQYIEGLQPFLASVSMFHNNNFKEYNIQDKNILYPKLDLENIMTDFIGYLDQNKIYNGNAFIYCISYPIKNLPKKYKMYMRRILQPTDEIKYRVQETIQRLELNVGDYTVFHIRSGDEYLKDNYKLFDLKYLGELMRELHSYIYPNEKYMIIADNNEVKLLLKQEFPDIKIHLGEITHFGEGMKLEEEKVKNTLIDFYVMSFAKKIVSFSNYEHGSGFSFWCAKTYDIPYVAKCIKHKQNKKGI